jgi:hypothetical protein
MVFEEGSNVTLTSALSPELPGRDGKQSLAVGNSAQDQEDDLRCRIRSGRTRRAFVMRTIQALLFAALTLVANVRH